MKFPEVSKELNDWLWKYCLSWEGGHKWKIVWVSVSERFILVHKPSSLQMSGRDQVYDTVRYDLIDRKDYYLKGSMMICKLVCYFEGRRFSKVLLAEAIVKMRSYFHEEIRNGFEKLCRQEKL